MAAVLLIIGALLVVAGTALIHVPSALIVAGCLTLAGGVDMTRRQS